MSLASFYSIARLSVFGEVISRSRFSLRQFRLIGSFSSACRTSAIAERYQRSKSGVSDRPSMNLPSTCRSGICGGRSAGEGDKLPFGRSVGKGMPSRYVNAGVRGQAWAGQRSGHDKPSRPMGNHGDVWRFSPDWAAYVVKRHPQLSPAHVCDQCGMAASLLAVLMFASTAWRAFGY